MLCNFDRKIELLDGFETDYVKILYYDLPENYSGNYKSYNYPRFCTILSGYKEITLDDHKKFTYDKNNFLLLPPNSNVHMDIAKHTTALVFEFNSQLIDTVLDKTGFPNASTDGITLTNDCFIGDLNTDVSKNINDIFSTSISRERDKPFLINLYAQKLIFDLLKSKSALNILKNSNTQPISIAIRYINENIHSIINIKVLANELHMSESNFSHIFKKVIGENPVEYINNKKLQLALGYLKTENVTEVAYNLGYSNISYFIKLFKNKYHITPKQYQLTMTCSLS